VVFDRAHAGDRPRGLEGGLRRPLGREDESDGIPPAGNDAEDLQLVVEGAGEPAQGGLRRGDADLHLDDSSPEEGVALGERLECAAGESAEVCDGTLALLVEAVGLPRVERQDAHEVVGVADRDGEY
jgi:hypothetical protein